MSLTKLTTVGLAMLFSWSAYASDFNVQLSEPKWDGVNIPKGQQCQKFGGKPNTPKLSISGIPEHTNLIIFEFSDRDYPKMDNGGHGRIGYALNKYRRHITTPSMPGHSFFLPEGFFMIEAHRSPKWDIAGAYMPPCSGGKNHQYDVTVKAVKFNGENATVLAEKNVSMGKY